MRSTTSASATATKATPTSTATATATAVATALATTAAIAFSMKSVSANEADRSLHRIGLARGTRFGSRQAADRGTAARTKTTTAAPKTASARWGAWILDKTLVKGLLQRIGNARMVDFFFEVGILIVTWRRWAVGLRHAVARAVLEALFVRTVALAAVGARIRPLLVTRWTAIGAWLSTRFVARLIARLVAWILAPSYVALNITLLSIPLRSLPIVVESS